MKIQELKCKKLPVDFFFSAIRSSLALCPLFQLIPICKMHRMALFL